MSNFIIRLQKLIAEKSLLAHPFYQHWAEGSLPLEVMQKYAEQYYHLEKNFPRFLSRLHTNCDDPITRQAITDNLYDEEHGENNHRELWLCFAEGIGASRASVLTTAALPETVAALATFTKLAEESTISGAAALAAYESQIPAVAKSKLMGLEKYYQITDPRTTAFFRVHSTLDIQHSNEWWGIIETKARDTRTQAMAERAACAGRDALWNFLTGICRAYFPKALATCS